MTSAFSWQNSISLCPASFRTPRPNLPVTPGGESQGQGSLVCCHLWGSTESATTDVT